MVLFKRLVKKNALENESFLFTEQILLFTVAAALAAVRKNGFSRLKILLLWLKPLLSADKAAATVKIAP